MKFLHMADCHIGSWRDPKMRNISTQAFSIAIDAAIAEHVDFVLIAGDLFNTSLPAIEWLKEATKKFMELKQAGIACYLIPGSHDFSPSGKTMLDVLEEAGMFINVSKGDIQDGKLLLRFTTDPQTGAKITGILGRRLGLDKGYYEDLIREPLEAEPGFKIFLFHALLTELKPKGMEHSDSHPISLLPKGFDYYAGGHVHIVRKETIEGYGTITYPGPLFPNSFSELEELSCGGYYLYTDGTLTWKPIPLYNTYHIKKDCSGKAPSAVEQELLQEIEAHEFFQTIVTLRLLGKLSSGKTTDIDFKKIFAALYDKSAYFVMRNTSALSSPEFEEIRVETGSVEATEEKIIAEHTGKIKAPREEATLIRELMQVLSAERGEGERVGDFEARIKEQADRILHPSSPENAPEHKEPTSTSSKTE